MNAWRQVEVCCISASPATQSFTQHKSSTFCQWVTIDATYRFISARLDLRFGLAKCAIIETDFTRAWYTEHFFFFSFGMKLQTSVLNALYRHGTTNSFECESQKPALAFWISRLYCGLSCKSVGLRWVHSCDVRSSLIWGCGQHISLATAKMEWAGLHFCNFFLCHFICVKHDPGVFLFFNVRLSFDFLKHFFQAKQVLHMTWL